MDYCTIKVLARGDFATSGSPSFACEESADCHREFLLFLFTGTSPRWPKVWRIGVMRSEVSFAGGQSPGEFPLDFFAAVNRHDEFEAVASIRRVALQPDGQPSPRVEELGGEWDSIGVGLCLVEEGCCAGSVGTGDERQTARSVYNGYAQEGKQEGGSGMVHCSRRAALGFALGAEFTNGSRWRTDASGRCRLFGGNRESVPDVAWPVDNGHRGMACVEPVAEAPHPPRGRVAIDSEHFGDERCGVGHTSGTGASRHRFRLRA
jgi:hypothetical protein